MQVLVDIEAESAVIAGLMRHGSEGYFDVADILSANTFSSHINAVIFKCIKSLIDKDTQVKIDIPSIQSEANGLELGTFVRKPEAITYLEKLVNTPIFIESLRKLAGKIRKLEIARLLRGQLQEAGNKILEIKGDEPVLSILAIAEDAIFDFSSLINENDGPVKIGQDATEIIKHIEDNPCDNLGVPTGFKLYDASIGGGLRNGTVNLIGARTKGGKSQLGACIAKNIAEENIPVIYMDTEMQKSDHFFRMMANISDVPINTIETGRFNKNPLQRDSVRRAAQLIEKLPVFHRNITGVAFEEQIAIMRRWLTKEVGLNPDGKAKPAVVVYDYIKLMTADGISSSLQEYQLLGFLTSALHNFSVRYGVPVLALIQLNRDGITKESTDAASGSDRIIWLCSNFTILKKKSDEEIAQDGPSNGNRKLVVLAARHGPGTDDGDYINLFTKLECGKIIEGRLKSQLSQPVQNDDDEPQDFN